VLKEDRCENTELLVTACGCPLHRGGRTVAEQVAAERAELLLTPGWFAASFPGCCVRCGIPFRAGAAIRREPGVGWRAECCP
jgi:hypothetical protein